MPAPSAATSSAEIARDPRTHLGFRRRGGIGVVGAPRPWTWLRLRPAVSHLTPRRPERGRRQFPDRLLATSLLAAGLCFAPAWGGDARAGAAKSYAFVSPQYVITAEQATPRSFVVNIINLSEFVIVVQPNEFIYKVSSGRFFIGQVFDVEHKDTRGETYKYSAAMLVKGHSFTGLTVLGAFRDQDQIEELSLRVGARRYYLDPLPQLEFEQLARKIGELDLKSPDPKVMLQEANIAEIGSVKTTDGTSEWDRDWQGLINENGENPPKVIEKSEVLPTEEARKAKVFGKVRMSSTITRNGALQDLKVEKGLGHGLDERALEAVRNSWVFLPATKNGEVLESFVRFDVDFPPPAPPKRP